MDLYKEGKVKVGPNGLFKVSGYYEADTEKMTCTCPDCKTRKEPCKHIYVACLFVKNRGKEKIEPVNGNGDWITEMMNSTAYDKPKEAPNKAQEAPNTDVRSKPFDRQSTITRLAVLNTATEILKTHNKPIRSEDLFKVASQLEKWALNGGE